MELVLKEKINISYCNGCFEYINRHFMGEHQVRLKSDDLNNPERFIQVFCRKFIMKLSEIHSNVR